MACFELEKVIAPHRPPSSTIAVNKHAQFRPHRDTGAGNGQSNSLIVGLGDYSGGGMHVCIRVKIHVCVCVCVRLFYEVVVHLTSICITSVVSTFRYNCNDDLSIYSPN